MLSTGLFYTEPPLLLNAATALGVVLRYEERQKTVVVQQKTVVPTTADKRRESTTGYKPLCVSTPGDGHCFDEIGRLQVQRLLNTLQHGTDDDDNDEMQLVAQTAQQLKYLNKAKPKLCRIGISTW